MGGLVDVPRRGLAELFEFGPAEKNRLLAMEGLRGVAVLLVFCVHYPALFGAWLHGDGAGDGAGAGVARVMAVAGNIGVDMFFVLSGYLIYGAAIKRPLAYGTFLRRRVRRIYPTFLAVFVVYVALAFATHGAGKLPSGAGATVLYLAANLLLLPGLFPIEPLITVAWSLSYEFAYYVTLPLVVAALRMREWAPRVRIRFFVALLVAFLAAAAVVGWLPARLGMFVAGIVLYDVRLAEGELPGPMGRPREFALVGTGLALVVAGVCVGWPCDPPSIARIAAQVGGLAAGFGLVTYVAFVRGTIIGRAMSWAPLRWLGNMSYSFYLVHGLSLQFASVVMLRLVPAGAHTDVVFWLFLPVAVVFAMAASAGLFLLVERPFSLESSGRHARRRAWAAVPARPRPATPQPVGGAPSTSTIGAGQAG